MIHTMFGSFDGPSWERLCRAAFVLKYGDRFQRMPASPGDFGIEGWTTDGFAFQCYCPEKDYTQKELYDSVRDKITKDIPKLQQYEKEIAERIGPIKIRAWLLVTPNMPHNDIHKHARVKETLARGWNSPILATDFTILIQDAEHYVKQFEEHRAIEGTKLHVGPQLSPAAVLLDVPEEFQKLIDRKNRVRLKSRNDNPGFDDRLKSLNAATERKFIQCDRTLSDIEKVSPQAYQNVLNVIGHYAEEMEELQYTWPEDPQKLIDRIKADLSARLAQETRASIGVNDAQYLADLMVSRWLAVCQLDFLES